MIGLAIIIVLLVLLLPQALFIVPQQNVYIIERLGKFNRTVGAGLNIKSRSSRPSPPRWTCARARSSSASTRRPATT